MKREYILPFLLIVLTGGSQAKQLSKSEIKSIIQEASRHKGRYKVTTKIKTRNIKSCRTNALQKPKKAIHPSATASAQKTVTQTVKKQEPILPFQLTPSFKNADVKIGQKGFVLIKGEPERKKKDPLYKL